MPLRTFALIAFLALLTASASAGVSLPSQTYFVPNEGQWDGNFAFKYDGNGVTCFLTPSGMTIDLHQVDRPPRNGIPSSFSPSPTVCHPDGTPEGSRARTIKGHVLRFSFLSSNPIPTLMGEDKLSHYSNHFLSRDSCRWRSRVPHYGKVMAKDVWPGVDIEYLPTAEGVEAVYHLHPFADAGQIQLRYEGQDAPLQVDGQGNLLLQTSLGPVKEKAPFAYQIINHRQTEIPCRFDLLDAESYRMVLEPYDATQEVVIDPLIYSSRWGGGGVDMANAMTEDSHGNILLTGWTTSENTFPTSPGAYRDSSHYGQNFLSKFSPGGDTLRFSTFLGGGNLEALNVMADSGGRVYVVGDVGLPSSVFPLTPDAFDTVAAGTMEGFLQRYSSDGTALEFSSFLGGNNRDYIIRMGMDSTGDVYLCGGTRSPDFPITADALYPSSSGGQDGFLAIFHPATTRLSYATYFPGRGVKPYALTVESSGRVWIGGGTYQGTVPVTDDAYQHEPNGPGNAFLAHLDLHSNTLLYGTYLGGHVSGLPPGAVFDVIYRILPLSVDTVALFGSSMSWDFPVTPDAFDTMRVDTTVPGSSKRFLSMLALPSTLVHSTMLGVSSGESLDDWGDLAVDPHGAFVGAATVWGIGYPVTSNGYDTTWNGDYDGYVYRLSHDLRHLQYGSYIGGGDYDYAEAMLLDRQGGLWLGGGTESTDFPVTPNALRPHGGSDAFYLCLTLPEDSSDITSVIKPVPESFTLSAYPNPFNPSTTLTFTLPHASNLGLNLYNIQGQQIFEKDEGRLERGEHRIFISGESLASGIYFAKLSSRQFSATTKLVLIR